MVVFFLASTDEKDAAYKNHASGMLFASFLMVMFQICTVCGVLTGTILPSCATNYQCKEAQDSGTFCELRKSRPGLHPMRPCSCHSPRGWIRTLQSARGDRDGDMLPPALKN